MLFVLESSKQDFIFERTAQRVIKMAEEYPEHPEEKALPPFDPMTTSLGLFFKTVQLFVFLSFARDMSRATGIMR